MKRILFLFRLLLFSVLLVACTTGENGELQFPWLIWVVLIIFIVIAISIGISSSISTQKKVIDSLEKMGMKRDEFKSFGTYVGGHPDADITLSDMQIYKEKNMIRFYQGNILISTPTLKFSIDADKIINIEIEDATSIEKRLTVGRLLLVGVFAFAWKKKKKNELSFVVIDWNDGRFDHSTTFSFEGQNAMQKANIARNNLINFCK